MIFSHKKWGQFTVSLDAFPSLSISHSIGYNYPNHFREKSADGVDMIAECQRVPVSSVDAIEINRASYKLAATVDLGRGGSVWWGSAMTPKAKEKLNSDPTLDTELLAFVRANMNELRQEALTSYRARIAEQVAALRANADAIEQGAGAEHSKIALEPGHPKAVLIADLMNRLRDSLIAQVPRMPEDWDGLELRELIKDYVAEQAIVGTGMDRARKRLYHNEVIIRNLG